MVISMKLLLSIIATLAVILVMVVEARRAEIEYTRWRMAFIFIIGSLFGALVYWWQNTVMG